MHLKFLNLPGDIDIFTNDIETVAIKVPIGEQKAVGVKSNDRLGHVHSRLDLQGEHDGAVLLVGHLGDLVEGDVVLVVLLRDCHSVDLMPHTFCVLLEPVKRDNVSVNFTS